MRLYKYFLYDIKNSTTKKYVCIIVSFVVICIFACIDFSVSRKVFEDSALSTGQMLPKSLADISMYLFGGMKVYIPNPDTPFMFPAFWLIFYTIIFYGVLIYPYKDLQGFGASLLVYAGSRKKWWLSKCVWVITNITIYFVIAWLLIILYLLVIGGQMNFVLSEYVFEIFSLDDSIYSPQKCNMFLILVICPYLFAVATALIQTLLSLLIKPVFSFICIEVLLISSAYYCSPFLIGNYAMGLRNSEIISNGTNSFTAIVISILIILAVLIVGNKIFSNYDIFGKE